MTDTTSTHQVKQEELFGHRFSIDRSGNRPLDLNEIVERTLQKYSDPIGLTPEQAAKMLETLLSQKSGEEVQKS